MRTIARAATALLLCGALAAGCGTTPPPHGDNAAAAPTPAQFVAIPPNKDTDLKFYLADGHVVTGGGAMERMHEASVVLWLAGNQFFAMDDVVRAFQRANPGLTVGMITLPPGLLLAAIEKGGWRYGGRDYAGKPDVYASVNLGHLRKLRQAGLMRDYEVYMHNEMVLMVARGNPKGIRGIEDLRRDDVRTSMPNPVNEGIMQFYGRKVLEKHGLWDAISGGKSCVSCQVTPRSWFTAVHHRETPDRILAGQSDTGIVWLTETIAAQRAGKPVEAVRLPSQDSLRDEVAYAIGPLTGSSHAQAAARYLAFLASPEAQHVYAGYGFVPATAEELRLRPIP